ncbi:carboxymuconolactone decarboxylase family protein, partial [Nocardioides sp.]|uniref:carboxymuconolactone decarboxylase family protein n=1 Tax=Nocardioides sp. TaxID=35761 RepID=UPI00356A0F67
MRLVAKKHYSVGEIYSITHQAARTRRFLAGSRLGADKQFTERIMLAVTEVNGCELCSYAHARFALRAGLSATEVRALLGGNVEGIPDDQLPAIAFAQHYADSRGHPDTAAWQALVAGYGEREALGVLAAVRIMMWGNALGIPLSSLRSRMQGSPDPGSSLRYEVATLVGSTVLTPLALIHALVSTLRGK